MMFQSSLLGNGMVFKSKSNDIYEEFCMINRSCSHILEWTVKKEIKYLIPGRSIKVLINGKPIFKCIFLMFGCFECFILYLILSAII